MFYNISTMLIKIDEAEKITSNVHPIIKNLKACFLIEDSLYGVFIQSRNQYESKFMTGD